MNSIFVRTKPFSNAQLRFGAKVERIVRDKDLNRVTIYDGIQVVDGARTPYGKMNGPFRNVSVLDLMRVPAIAVLKRNDVRPEQIGEVVVGNVIPNSPQANFLHKRLALSIGIPDRIIANTVQRLCGTGVEVVDYAAKQLIEGGDTFILAAMGENMTRTPDMDNEVMSRAKRANDKINGATKKLFGPGVVFALPQLVSGSLGVFRAKYLRPHQLNPIQTGLTDPAIGGSDEGEVMYQTADRTARKRDVTVEVANEYAAASHRKLHQAVLGGLLDREVVPVTEADLTGESRFPKGVKAVNRDGQIRAMTTASGLNKKKFPPLQKGGLHTFANASGIVDGGSALLISTREMCEKLGLNPLAEYKATAVVGGPGEDMGILPVKAIKLLLEKTGMDLDQIESIEINEAFGGQVAAVVKELARDLNYPADKLVAKLNPEGGAIGLGHPIASTGGRMIMHSAFSLNRPSRQDDKPRYAIGAACIGGGQGIAYLLKKPPKPDFTQTPGKD